MHEKAMQPAMCNKKRQSAQSAICSKQIILCSELKTSEQLRYCEYRAFSMTILLIGQCILRTPQTSQVQKVQRYFRSGAWRVGVTTQDCRHGKVGPDCDRNMVRRPGIASIKLEVDKIGDTHTLEGENQETGPTGTKLVSMVCSSASHSVRPSYSVLLCMSYRLCPRCSACIRRYCRRWSDAWSCCWYDKPNGEWLHAIGTDGD